MPIINKVQETKYKIGVFAPRNLTDILEIENALLPNKDKIEHIFTNDVEFGGLNVMKFCSQNGIPYTVCPVHGSSILKVNSCIIKDADYIVIFDDGKSTNTKNVVEQCGTLKKKFKIVNFSGVGDAQKIAHIAQNMKHVLTDMEDKAKEGQTVDLSAINKLVEKLTKTLDGTK